MTYQLLYIIIILTLGSNNYAISAGGIGEGLKRSASYLQVSGNTIDQSIAMITAMSEITQDPAEAGNALKILAMRLRGAKTEIEAAGEDTDGMAESTSKLREQIKALTNVDGNGGFDIMLNEDYEMVLAKSAQIGGHPEEDNTEGKAQIHGKKFRNHSYNLVFENPLTTTVA